MILDSLTYGVRTRFHECDPQGRVFNARFLEYIDTAMVEFLRTATGSYRRLARAGFDYVVAQTTLRFHLPAHLDDWLEISLAPKALGDSSLAMCFTVICQERVIAEVDVDYVCIERVSARPASWPEFVRAAVSDHSVNRESVVA